MSARLELFGFASTAAEVGLTQRPRSQRLVRAGVALVIAWALAPVVVFIPPHVPWPLAALGAGVYLARRRWRAEFRIESFTGRCPRCGADARLATPATLKPEHPVTCMECHSELTLDVDVS